MTTAGSIIRQVLGALLLCLVLIETGLSATTAPATGKNARSSVSGLPNKHPEPKRVGGYSWHPPADTVRATSGKRNNIFFVGEPVTFLFKPIDQFGVPSTVVSYEVRDYWGNMVDEGPGYGLDSISVNKGGRELSSEEYRRKAAARKAQRGPIDEFITVKVSTPGWYKLYCYGTDVREAWGDCIGTTTFVIFRKKAGFPEVPPPDTRGGSAGSMDEIARGICGIGPQRHAVKNPIGSMIENLAADVALDKEYYMPFDPIRRRALLVAFPEGIKDHGALRTLVERFKDDIQYYEPRNEPNDSPPIPFAQVEMKEFYETIKGVDQKLKVIGPGLVDIRAGMLNWVDVFLNAGGGRYIDAFSFHCYNAINGDLALARKSLDAVEATLATYGMEHIEKWQTEQGFGSTVYGVYQPHFSGRWTMLEMMVFEQYGIPKERNHLWYDRSHGFWDVPTWWENEDNSLEPAAALMRVFAEELYGTVFDQAYDFGPAGNNLYLGSLFVGPGKRVAAFMSAGSTDGKIELAVRGGRRLRVVSAFGVEQDLSIANGRVVLDVPELPVYVELADEQKMDVLPLVWGENIARDPEVVVTSSQSDMNPEDESVENKTTKLVNGELETWYWSQQNHGDPWMADLKDGPVWIEFSLPKAQPVSHVVIYASPPWQRWGTLLDYELQYDSRGAWKTIEHVKEPTRTIGVYSSNSLSTVDSFFSDRCIFRHDFKPVMTKKIRVVINNATMGGGPDTMTKEAGGQCGEFACVREIEIYGATPRAATLVTVQPGQIRQPKPVRVLVHASQNDGSGFASKVRVTPPEGWTASPSSAVLASMRNGQRETLQFVLTPSGKAEPGILPVKAEFIDGDRVIRSETSSFEMIAPVGMYLSLKPVASGMGVEAMLRNITDAPLPVDVSLFVDGARAGRAKHVTLDPGSPQSVTMPLSGVKATGTTQTIQCTVTGGNRIIGRKEVEATLIPCQYIGPWACAFDGEGFKKRHPPEREIDFSKSYDTDDGRARWQRGVAGFNGYFDFLPRFKTNQFVIAYAAIQIHSDRMTDARFSFGSDDGIKTWLNGAMVTQNDVQRGAEPGQETASVTLKKGWNTVLIGVTQNVAGWGFYFSVTDANGEPLTGIYLADSKRPWYSRWTE